MSTKLIPTEAAFVSEKKKTWLSPKWVLMMVVAGLGALRLLSSGESRYPSLLPSSIADMLGKGDVTQVVRRYSLDVGVQWMNPGK